MVGREEKTRHWAQSRYEQHFYELKEKDEHNTAPPHSTTQQHNNTTATATTAATNDNIPNAPTKNTCLDSKQEARG